MALPWMEYFAAVKKNQEALWNYLYDILLSEKSQVKTTY